MRDACCRPTPLPRPCGGAKLIPPVSREEEEEEEEEEEDEDEDEDAKLANFWY